MASIYTQASISSSSWATANELGIIQGGQDAGKSGTLSVLGEAGSVPVPVYPVPGAKVVYFNPHVARQVGIPVGPGNSLTHEVSASLVRRFALRVDGDKNQPARILRATRYGQSEINGGDGRAAMLDEANLVMKGVGRTSLVETNLRGREVDLTHSNGHMTVHVALTEAMVGEAVSNLLGGGPRTLAIIDLGNRVISNSRFPEPLPAVILVRAGLQVRPAHFIEPDVYFNTGRQKLYVMWKALQEDEAAASAAAHAGNTTAMNDPTVQDPVKPGTVRLEAFLRASHLTGLLQYREYEGEIVPDLAATIRVMMDLMARTNAREFRWRLLMGAPSAGNAQIDGNLLDFSDISANPRTGRVYSLPYSFPYGEPEYQARAINWQMVHESLRVNMAAEEIARYNLGEIDFIPEHMAMVKAHLSVEMLKATGFKSEVAIMMDRDHRDLATEYRDALYALATMENPGTAPRAFDKDGRPLVDGNRVASERAVVDVFGMLGRLPEIYFKDGFVTTEQVLKALEPIYLGNEAAQREQVRVMAEQLATLYNEVMRIVLTEGLGAYDDEQGMKDSIVAKASFESVPLESLYFWQNLKEMLAIFGDREKIDTLLTDPIWVSRYIRERSAAAMRNYDALVNAGEVRALDKEGVWEVGLTTLDHVDYGIFADTNDGTRKLFVRIPLEVAADGRFFSPAIPDASFTLEHLPKLEMHVDGNGSIPKLHPRIVIEGGQRYLVYEAPVRLSQAGLMSGTFDVNSVQLNPYPFVAPDNRDVLRLAERERRLEDLATSPADMLVVSGTVSAGSDSRDQQPSDGEQG